MIMDVRTSNLRHMILPKHLLFLRCDDHKASATNLTGGQGADRTRTQMVKLLYLISYLTVLSRTRIAIGNVTEVLTSSILQICFISSKKKEHGLEVTGSL